MPRKIDLKTYYINPDLFFIFEKGEFCLWNYRDHEQFEVQEDLTNLLMSIAQKKAIANSHPLLKDLLDNNIISVHPYKEEFWGWDKLSHIFHKGTQNVPELSKKRTKKEMIADFIGFSKGYAEKKLKKLPDKKEGRLFLSKVDKNLKALSFIDTIQNRFTSRYFSGKSLSEQELSTMLYYTFGECQSDWEGVESSIQLIGVRKTSPSAGGVHSIQAFVVVFAVDNVDSGLYLYDAKDHSLSLVHPTADFQTLIPIMADQFYMEGLSFGVFFVSDLTKVWEKYLHSRAYREIFLDAGHLSQTLQLLATSLSCQTWISGYFRDNDLMKYLEINQETQAPLLFVGVGKGERTPLHPDMLEALKSDES